MTKEQDLIGVINNRFDALDTKIEGIVVNYHEIDKKMGEMNMKIETITSEHTGCRKKVDTTEMNLALFMQKIEAENLQLKTENKQLKDEISDVKNEIKIIKETEPKTEKKALTATIIPVSVVVILVQIVYELLKKFVF